MEDVSDTKAGPSLIGKIEYFRQRAVRRPQFSMSLLGLKRSGDVPVAGWGETALRQRWS
jgi:hypothetical protein